MVGDDPTSAIFGRIAWIGNELKARMCVGEVGVLCGSTVPAA